ncbi:uncharacterized protein LOC142354330 [Convolutriloba macropyga]|uniref:uncharacterized protein LOC142354330 n=1 Tax=Convolutriloba macropyga TaxID=536237 RepID=UPI003F52104A
MAAITSEKAPSLELEAAKDEEIIGPVLRGDTCLETTDKAYKARAGPTAGITKIESVALLTSADHMTSQGYSVYLCVGLRCSGRCQDIKVFQPEEWAHSRCGGMPAEYVRVETRDSDEVLSFCDIRVYGRPVVGDTNEDLHYYYADI